MFTSIQIEFPDDWRAQHKIFFSDYYTSGWSRVKGYVVFLSGITYRNINENISFSHESIGDCEGIHFFSGGIPLK